MQKKIFITNEKLRDSVKLAELLPSLVHLKITKESRKWGFSLYSCMQREFKKSSTTILIHFLRMIFSDDFHLKEVPFSCNLSLNNEN